MNKRAVVYALLFYYKYRYKETRLMDVLETKTDRELLQSVLAETAKALNEVNCAVKDCNKARNRLTFEIAVVNELLNRSTDKEI